MTSTFFWDLRQLAELPWFELEGDRLKLDPSFGPVFDAHTHLALSFVLPSRVSQERASEPVRTYLPESGRAIDLEVYINKNFTPADLRRMKVDLILGSFLPGGPRKTHTAVNLLRRMADMQITHSMIHAVDLPFISNNSEVYLRAARRHPELLPFGSAHPASPLPGRRVRRLVQKGARGMKVHPSSQAFFPNDPRVAPIYEACRDAGVPVFWHCGPAGIEPERTRRFALVRYYEEPIATYPEVTFFLGHSGCLQYLEAIQLAKRYPNVVMDLSCQGLDGTRVILEEVDHDRIVYGSDWPFYNQAPGIAKVLIASEGDRALQRKILHDNVARLMGIGAAHA